MSAAANVVSLKPRVTIEGSEAAAAAGIDPHVSRVGLWLVKTERLAPPSVTEAMEWGKRLEDDIDDALRERGYQIQPPPHPEVVDPERPWLLGHPDAYAIDRDGLALLERKAIGPWERRVWNGEAPNHYAAELQHHLHLTGLERGLLAVLVGGQKLETWTVHRSQAAIEALIELEEEFHGYVRDDVWPSEWKRAPYQPADARLLDALPGVPDKKCRLGRRTSWPLLAQRREAKEKRDAWQAELDRLDARLKVAMRDATVAIDPWDNEVIRWTPMTRHTVNVKRLREERPEVAAEFEEESATRRFTVL